jgi:hypothetical protein
MIDLNIEPYIEKKEIKPSLTREQFETAIANGEDIIGFIGAVEIPVEKLKEDVAYLNFGLDEEGKAIVKTYEEAFFVSRKNDTTALIVIGDKHGRTYDGVNDPDRLRLIVEHFGVDKVMTKSEYHDKAKSYDTNVDI